MPSTYTNNNGIELPATGEQSGTWGDTVNTNMSIVDRLVTGVGTITLSGTTHTLTTTSGTLSDGMYRVLVFSGSPSGTNTVTISPNTQQKYYIVKNSSGQSVVLTQGSGGNVTVANGDVKIVYANGGGASAAVVDLTADLAMSSVNITGGTIDGSVIGGSSAAAGTFTTATVGAGLVGTPSLTTTGDTNTGLYFPAADTVAATTGGTERLRVNSSGNVGIGTSSPGATLDVVANTASDAVRITQTGAGNALVVEDSTNPDATPFVVEANGRLIVGSTSTQPSLGATNTPQIGVFGNSVSNNGFANYSYAVSASASFFNFAKSRSATPGSFAILSDGDDLGYVKFNGDDGTQFVEAARIWAEVDGTPGTNDMPGRLVFSTTPDGASTPTERMRIDSSGNVGIGTSSPNVLLNLAGSSTTALARIANTGSGASAFDGSGAGLELLATGMNLTSKYTPAIKFGSTDTDFTTTNPKFGAALVATAVQTYSSDTTGGMNLEFWTAPANPGTGSGLVERMRIDSSGNVGIGTSSPGQKLTVAGTVESTSGGFKFPDGTTQSSAASSSTFPEFLTLNAGVI